MFPGFPSNRRRKSISYYLLPGLILVVVATVIAAALPAIAAVWIQLERQIWLRVESAQAATLSLYAEEYERLDTVAGLIAQRPTLCVLVGQRDEPALNEYLLALQDGTDIDALLVITEDGQVFGLETDDLPPIDFWLDNHPSPFLDYVVIENPSQLLIAALYDLQPPSDCVYHLPSTRLLAIKRLDDAYMRRIARQTRMVQGIIIDGDRSAASLSTGAIPAPDQEIAGQVAGTGIAGHTHSSGADGETYYVGLSPLIDREGEVIALSEVALPGGSIRRGIEFTILFMLIVSAGVAAGGSFLTLAVARRITQPLEQLTGAAARLGQGDLETLIVSTSTLSELDALARQLGSTRRRLRRARQHVLQGKQRVERLLEATHEGMITLDEIGYICSVSARAEEMLGYSGKEIRSEPYTKIFRPVPGETITLNDILPPRKGRSSIRRMVILDAHDRPVTLEVSSAWLFPDQPPNELQEWVIVLRDVSEEVALSRLRSVFLANVSHEFRTPLSAVIATAEILVEEGESLRWEELFNLANMIRISTLKLQRLIDNLLESAVIEAGYFRINCRRTHLDEVINESQRIMRPLLHRRGQRLVLDMQEAAPPFYADPDRLTQVLVNLLANASKFNPMGKPITLMVQKQDQMLYMAVLDVGPGLPTDRYADLFDRFVTGDRSKGAQYGVGLGLSVVKAIVEAHGGEVGAENRVEGGACVWLKIPLRQAPDCDRQDNASEERNEHP